MLERIRSFFISNRVIQRVRDLLESNQYPPLVALGVLIGYIFGIEMVTFPIIALIGTFGILISRDLRSTIPPLMMLPFSFTLFHSPGTPNYSDFYMQPWVFVIWGIIVFALVSSFVMHYILWGGARETFLGKNQLFPYHIILAIGLVLGGVGAQGYIVNDFLNGLSLVALWIVLYMVVLRGIKYDRETFTYFAEVCQWTAILLIGQLIYICLVNDVIQGDIIYKGNIKFGWGINNNFGGILVWLFPPVFYLAGTRKNGWLQLILSVAMMASIFFSMCRTALLIGVVIYLVCLAAVCFIGENKILFRAFTGAAVLVALFCSIVLREQLINIFQYYAERGFSDSGRFDLWWASLKNFFRYPIFGAGFHATPFVSWAGRDFGYCHNTVIQMFSACGLIGGIGYLIMRAKTIWLTVFKMTTERFFLGVSLAALLGVSLLDNHMFNIYPAFFYAIVIAMIENDFTQTVPLNMQTIPGCIRILKEKRKDALARKAASSEK